MNSRIATPDTVEKLAAQREFIAQRAAELNRMEQRLGKFIDSAQATLVTADA